MSKSRPHSYSSKPLLYYVVFDAVVVKCLTIALFIFFLIHPTLPVFAAELSNDTSADEPVQSSTTAPVLVEEQEVESESVVTQEIKVVSTPRDSGEEENKNIESPSPVTEVSNDVSKVQTESEEGSKTENVNTASSLSTSSPIATTIESNTGNDNASSTSLVIEDVVLLPISTTTPTTTVTDNQEVENIPDTAAQPLPVVKKTVNEEADVEPEKQNTTTENVVYVAMETTSDSNRHVFSTNECVGVGNGSYYCYKTSNGMGVIADDGAYAAPDADGDFEIFISLDGKTLQLTHNTLDDRAPYYDATSNEVVFHRLIDGRYQIVSYDLDKAKETQITSTDANSMEPTQSDGVTVWQEWVGNNWEIAALIKDEIVILSNSEHNDVAPSVKDGYVMWHTLSASGEKLLSVYEIETGITSRIADPDGGQVSNPRFVLVYDTTFDNGDTVTKTYDPETGVIEPISNKPWQDKQSIPDPEPAGETSAIINTKPATRDGGREDGDVTSAGPEPVGGNGLTSTSGLTSETSSNSSASTTRDINLATTSDPFSLSEFDLVVTPYEATSSAQQNYSASTSDSVE